MQLRADQLTGHLARGLAPVYLLHGDEPLLAQEAADAIRASARAAGHTERQVFNVAGAHFDWSSVLGAAQEMSLFADRQLIEIRIASGKPGKDGSDALQRYCRQLADGVVTLVQCPRLDGQQQKSAWFSTIDGAGVVLRLDPIERPRLPAWIAARLALQGQRVAAGEDGQRTLAFFADRVEGNLLAAHQELQKLALLHPRGELTLADVQAAVLDVARYDVFRLGEAVLGGQVARALRMLDGLRAEGQAPVLVHWTLADDIRAVARCRAAVDDGRPLPLALREARVWGAKEKLFERALPAIDGATAQSLVAAASICDGVVKGLRHPEWPDDAWDALRRLVLLLLQAVSGQPLALAAERLPA